MGQYDDERARAAELATEGLVGDGVLPPAYARLFSRGLVSDWIDESIQWRRRWSTEALQDAMRLVEAASVLDELGKAEAARAAWRRSGELLEWMTRAKDPLSSSVPIALLAGAAFQLGQLPAMALALLQREEVRAWASPVHAAFLAGDLAATLDLTSAYWANRLESTGLRGSIPRLEEGQGAQDYIVHELVRCIGLIAGALRQGHTQRLRLGLRKLETISGWSLRTAGPSTALLIRLELETAKRFAERSIFAGLRPLMRSSVEARRRALADFASGLVASGRPLMWPSQARGIAQLAAGDSFAICTPTGSGKTMVAMLAALLETIGVPTPEGLDSALAAQLPAPIALYLVPSRALAMEVEREARQRLSPCGLEVSSLYGGIDWGSEELDLSGTVPRILVATVEKAEAIMRLAGADLEARIRLLIIDEAHQAIVREVSAEVGSSLSSGENRALRLEGFVSRLLARRPDVRRVALSAVSGNAEPHLAAWLAGKATSVVSPPGRSLRQIVGKLEFTRNRYSVAIDRYNGAPLDNDRSRFLALKVPAVPSGTPKTVTNTVYGRADAIALWNAVHLARRGRRVLISIGSMLPATLARASTALRSRAWKSALAAGDDLVSGAQGNMLYDQAKEALQSFMGPKSLDARLLELGVVAHHGQLPQVVRRLVTDLVREGTLRLVIATSTLSEGVNLPFDMVLLPVAGRRRSREVRRGREWYIESFDSEEFMNLAGRAGRPGMGRSMEGVTAVVMPKGSGARELRDAYDEVLQKLDQGVGSDQPVFSPLQILLEWIVYLAKDRLGIDGPELAQWMEAVAPASLSGEVRDAIDNLDQVVLGAIAEAEAIADSELSASEAEQRISALWASCFASVVAEEEDRLGQLIRLRAKAVVALYSSRPERKRLYMVGLPPFRGTLFLPTAAALEAHLFTGHGYASWTAVERANWLARMVEVVLPDPTLGLRETGDRKKTEAVQEEWETHLRWWLGLHADFPSGAKLYDVLRFVQDQFEYRTGVAVGAVLADIWDRSGAKTGATDPDVWQATTTLPWVAYWVRDLLKWGTPHPVCAHLLRKGVAVSREAADDLRQDYLAWLQNNGHEDPAEQLRPTRIREWEDTRFPALTGGGPSRRKSLELQVTSEFEDFDGTLMAWPVPSEDRTLWLEPAGYLIGTTERLPEAAEAAERSRARCRASPSSNRLYWRQF